MDGTSEAGGGQLFALAGYTPLKQS